MPSLCWKIRSLASTTGLIITSLEELVILRTSVPAALKLKSLPAASNTISAPESKVIGLAAIVSPVVPSCVNVASSSAPNDKIAESLDSFKSLLTVTAVEAVMQL